MGADRPRAETVAAVAAAAALVALVAWSAAERWAVLGGSPYPVGVDGWFYAVQLRSLLDDGALQYPASPLAFYLAAPLAALTDPVTGAKLGAALGGAAIALPAYGVGRRLGGGRAAGLVAAAVATASAGSFYLSLEFVKNGVGMTVALTYAWLLLRALERPGRGRVAAAALGLAAAVLTHKLAAGLAVALTVPAVAVELRRRGVEGPWRVLAAPGRLAAAAILAATAAVAALAALAALLPGRFPGRRELRLLPELFAGDADWRLPALARGQRALLLGHEAALGAALAVLALAALAAGRWRPGLEPASVRPAERAMAATFALGALALAVPWLAVTDPQGLGFRLRLVAFVPLALCAAVVAGRALRPLPGAWPAAVAAAVALAVVSAPRARRDGLVEMHPALVAGGRALAGQLPADAVVICPERHLLFMLDWFVSQEVRLRPGRVPPERRVRVMPLAFIGRDSPVDRALVAARARPELPPVRSLHPRYVNGFVAVPEPTWQWVLQQLPADLRARFQRWRTI